MTPYLITDDQDLSAQNQDEMDRMHWCLCDVAEVYGNTDYKGMEGTEAGLETIYPDADPSGMKGSPLYKVISANDSEVGNRLAPGTATSRTEPRSSSNQNVLSSELTR